MAFSASLRKFAVTPAQTARLELSGIRLNGPDAPVLIMTHAGDSNPAFKSSLAKAQVDHKAIGSGTGDAAQRARNLVTARLFGAARVVTSWEQVFDDDGTPAECTAAKVTELLEQLLEITPDLFFRVVAFGYDVTNFRAAPAIDAEALGKP